MRKARLIDFYLGSLVKQARKDAGLARKDIAPLCGVAPSSIAAYEEAERAMPLSTALAILGAIRPWQDWLAPMSDVAVEQGEDEDD